MRVRGYSVELAVIDDQDREYGRIGTMPDPSGNPMTDIEIVVPEGLERIDIVGYRLYVDGILWSGPMPTGRESYANRKSDDGINIPSRMVCTVPLWMVDEIINVMEQVANSD